MKNLAECYTGKNEPEKIYVPDTMIENLLSSYEFVPLRGYGYILAVKDNGSYIGFIGIEKLGFKTVSEYLKSKGE